MIKREWTSEEDTLLRALASKVSIQRLAVKLKRQNASVVARAKVLDVPLIKARRLSNRTRITYT